MVVWRHLHKMMSFAMNGKISIAVKMYIWNKREYLSFSCGIFLMIIEKTTEWIFSLKEN